MDIENLIAALRTHDDMRHVEIEVQHGTSGEVMGYSVIWSVEERRPENTDLPPFLVLVAKIEP